MMFTSWSIIIPSYTVGFLARFYHPIKPLKPLFHPLLQASTMFPSSGTAMTSKSSEVTTSYNPKLPTQSTGQRIKNKNVFIRIADFFYTDKETNRKYRRTVFDKSDWKQHRNSNRYFREVANMPNSLILRGLGIPTMIVTVFSWMIVLHNVLVERFGLKIWPNWPLLSFPPLPFTLLSSALGLLLVFRTNVAYARWKDGRISWSMVSARSFDLMRQSLMWMNDERSKSRLVRYTVAFAKTMKWHLGHQGNDRRLHGDLEGVLTNFRFQRKALSCRVCLVSTIQLHRQSGVHCLHSASCPFKRYPLNCTGRCSSTIREWQVFLQNRRLRHGHIPVRSSFLPWSISSHQNEIHCLTCLQCEYSNHRSKIHLQIKPSRHWCNYEWWVRKQDCC